ncbi:MAG: glycosyltransferase family 4 protein [Phycisphaerales bacterium]|nr:glycosyltransferase family 4 protein [Phycisphaerales bacterium]
MRLLYVCSDWGIRPDGTKGAAIHLRAITRALADLGHEVFLLSPRGVPGVDHPARPVVHEPCDLAEDAAKLLRDWLGDRGLPQGAARELRPLIFNAWAPGRAADALRLRPPDAVIERLSLFGHLGLDLAQAFDVPLILEVNAPLTNEAGTFRGLQLQALAAEMESRVLRSADRVAAVSKELARRLADDGVDAERIQVVPNGVDLREFAGVRSPADVRAELGLGDGFVVGFAGSLKPWHGVDVLLQAFAEVARRDSEARLLLVGDGPTAAGLRAEVERLALTHRVVMTGAVPHGEIPDLLTAMDVAVAPFLPVEDFYFSPIKVFEYMAAGVCVIASRIGQLAEVIEDGVDGLLCAAGERDGLLAQLEYARRSPSWRRAAAERARVKVCDRYTWERAARQMVALVQSARDNRSESANHAACSGVAVG